MGEPIGGNSRRVSERGFSSEKLNLEDFRRVAQEQLDGTIRISDSSNDRLVNKGALRHRIASFLDSAARALGFMDKDTSRVDRQQAALRGFSDSLRSQYGWDIANRALAAVGLKDGNTVLLEVQLTEHSRKTGLAPVTQTNSGELGVLTGQMALDALAFAEQERARTEAVTKGIVTDAQPGGALYVQWMEELRLDEEPTGEVMDEFAARLEALAG
jgi:hypothetical protein